MFRLIIFSSVILSVAALLPSSSNSTSSNHTVVEEGFQHCTERGGCDCDCSWANPNSCSADDGSCCFGCCCGSSPNLDHYCPQAHDLIAAYGFPSLWNQGWQIQGDGGVATKAAFNLLGGYVEYDIDFSNVRTGVNGNLYTISPGGLSSWDGFTQNNYCDGAQTGSKFCLEVDWIESNGNCGGATTLHSVEGSGPNGCTSWGCTTDYHYYGRSSYHMRIEYTPDGQWKTIRDGTVINGYNLSPQPSSYDWEIIRSSYSSVGAVLYSSQWTGWVPLPDCGTQGDLYSSWFQVTNLQIYGQVVQGPTPTRC